MTNLSLPTLSPLRLPAAPAAPPLDVLLQESGAAFMGVYNPRGDHRDAASLRDVIGRAERLLAGAAALAEQLADAVEPESIEETKQQLGRFGFAWPNTSKADLAGYGATLLLDVADRQPCRYALRAALRELRQTSRFLPSIAEVLAALDAAQTRIRNTVWHLQELPAQITQARADLAQAEAREARVTPACSGDAS